MLAGLSFGGCSILLVAAYMSSIGKELSGYKKKYTTVICIIGAAAISVTVGILGLRHLGNIAESSQAAIPNLLIANQVFGSASGILGAVFAVIIPTLTTAPSAPCSGPVFPPLLKTRNP